MTALLIAVWLTAPASAPTSVRLHCDNTNGALRLSADGVEWSLSDEIRFTDGPLWSDDARPSGDVSVRAGEHEITASKKPTAGLYVGPPSARALLVAADVWALCGATDGAWAVVARDGLVRLVLIAADAPTVRFYDWAELVLAAQEQVVPSVVIAERALTLLKALVAPELPRFVEALALAPVADLRALAASVLVQREDAAARGALWLLAHDSDAGVRAATFAQVQRYCRLTKPSSCAPLLMMFMDDPNRDVAWTARDELLPLMPELALLGANADYKLDAMSLLAQRLQQDGRAKIRPLIERLALDDDGRVRAAAATLLAETQL